MMTNAKVTCFCLIAIASVASGCSSQGSFFGGSDFQITASEAGMRAYGDHLSALVTNSKASADAPTTPAYELRRHQTDQETERKYGYRPTFKPRLNGVPAGGQEIPQDLK